MNGIILPGRRRSSMTRPAHRGFTLIELLVVMSLMGIITLAVVAAFVAGIDADRNLNRQRQQADVTTSVERHITQLLQGARLGTATTDQTAYFLGGVTTGAGSTAATSQSAGGLQSASSSNTTSGTSDDGDSDLGCSRITFTTTAYSAPMSLLDNQDDFDTQQQNGTGPEGGLTEVSIGTTPQGGDSGDRTGLFERVQQPSDGDSSQGGMESLMSDQIQQIGFQFWDGTQWETSWDSTTTPDSGRLPAAVQVQYILRNDSSNTVHTFTVPILASDVTTTNPITTTSSTGGTTGGTQ